MIKIPEKEGRLSAAKAAHIEAVIAFVKRKTEGYRRDLFANISRVMLVSGTFEDMSEDFEADDRQAGAAAV